MKKELVTVCLAVVAALCLCMGLTACSEGGGNGGNVESGSQGGGNNEQEVGGSNKPSDPCEHVFTAQNVCEKCGDKWEFTEGLTYELDEETDTYHVINIHKAQGNVVVPYGYQGKFVTAVYGWTQEVLQEMFHSEEISEELFSSSLTGVVIPDSVTEIGDHAFCYRVGIKSVDFGHGVKMIGESAFVSCYGLQSIEIPDSVTEIGRRAFFECNGLISATLNSGVTEIGEGAFSECNKLIEVWNYSDLNIVAGEHTYGDVGYYAKHIYTTETEGKQIVTEDGYIFYEDMGEVCLLGYRGIEAQLKLPEKSPSGKDYIIYVGAFCYCSELTSVEIGSGVTSIGVGAFFACEGLTSIEIPESVAEIGWNAFYNCSRLSSIQFKGTVKKWKMIENSGTGNNYGVGDYTVTCSDGTVDKDGNVTYFE